MTAAVIHETEQAEQANADYPTCPSWCEDSPAEHLAATLHEDRVHWRTVEVDSGWGRSWALALRQHVDEATRPSFSRRTASRICSGPRSTRVSR